MDRKVKGALFINLIRIIKNAKDLPWGDHLTKEDMEHVMSMVIPSEWYPAEQYERIGLAVWKLVGGGTPEGARAYGEIVMKQLLEGIYGSQLRGLGHIDAIRKFMAMQRNQMSFSRIEVTEKGDKACRVEIFEAGGIEIMSMFIHLVSAQLELLVKFNGGEVVAVSSDVSSDTDNPVCTIDLEWK